MPKTPISSGKQKARGTKRSNAPSLNRTTATQRTPVSKRSKVDANPNSLTLKQRRKLRKQNHQFKVNEEKSNGGTVVCGEGQGSFWEVETVVGRRVQGGRVQYLVRWKGFSEAENTWEPAEHLCDTAMGEALRYTKRMKKKVKELEMAGERLLAPEQDARIETVTSAQIIPDEVPSDIGCQSAATSLEDGRWEWTDEEQINYQQVERINVADLDAKERVTAARVNGTPVVLIGHVGWANFATAWLEPQLTSSDQVKESGKWLDLAKPHRLNIDKIIENIGNEEVPVVRRNYSETNPIHGNILASKFLKTCWPTPNEVTPHPPGGTLPKLYLHQWQFPLSDMAGRKLCHQSNPLPNDILGEDLLKFWLDLPQCKGDSPLQYLFMGREETMSKLHRDNGGLAISIAPIVGEKECVLVHRSDGANCLYHLDAKLDDIDLHAYPLMAHARIWKVLLIPGEILLMPQGTYHQCRNVTPCLSYSRFHLDTVNLLAFLQSMIDGDAPEILHEEVLWNCTTELIRHIDCFVDTSRKARKVNQSLPIPPLNKSTVKIVETVRALRHICREISRRENIKNAVKGKKVPGTSVRCIRPSEGPTHPPLVASPHGSTLEVGKADHVWSNMVDDIDICLHEFRYRNEDRFPPFRPRRLRLRDRALMVGCSEVGESRALLEGFAARALSKGTDIESAFLDLPHVCAPSLDDTKRAALSEGDHVVVQIHGRRAEGTIVSICSLMDAAYLSYEDYPAIFDEYQPYEKLRSPLGGDRLAEIPPEEVRPGLVVVNRWGDLGDEYRAVIDHTSREIFFQVRLNLGCSHILRWLPTASIVKKT